MFRFYVKYGIIMALLLVINLIFSIFYIRFIWVVWYAAFLIFSFINMKFDGHSHLYVRLCQILVAVLMWLMTYLSKTPLQALSNISPFYYVLDSTALVMLIYPILASLIISDAVQENNATNSQESSERREARKKTLRTACVIVGFLLAAVVLYFWVTYLAIMPLYNVYPSDFIIQIATIMIVTTVVAAALIFAGFLFVGHILKNQLSLVCCEVALKIIFTVFNFVAILSMVIAMLDSVKSDTLDFKFALFFLLLVCFVVMVPLDVITFMGRNNIGKLKCFGSSRE